MKAIRVHQPGGPEALRYEDVAEPAPQAGEVLVRLEAAGVNFIDVYFRSGQYKPATLPFTLGQEGAGLIEAVGSSVEGLKVGDRVAFTGVGGAYAERAVVPAARLVPIPAGVPSHQAAAAMLQGMTAHYLATSTFPLQRGHTCLIHAAAGGVGLLLVQMAKLRGARVLGTVSTEEKAALAREAGADEIIFYTRQDFVAETRRLTQGEGVDVVYDSVGKTTFLPGLDALKPRGLMALFGQSSGAVEPVVPQLLNQKGSLFLTRPSLQHYVHSTQELRERSDEIFGWIASGRLKLRIHQTYPLSQAADAHRALEGRQTSGKLLLDTLA